MLGFLNIIHLIATYLLRISILTRVYVTRLVRKCFDSDNMLR